jgi:hypothetical protein
MKFTKKQASIASVAVSVGLGVVATPMTGIVAAVGFFILLTA